MVNWNWIHPQSSKWKHFSPPTEKQYFLSIKLFSFISFINAQPYHSLYTIYVTLFFPNIFLLMVHKWHCFASSSTSQPLDRELLWDGVDHGGYVGHQEGAGDGAIESTWLRCIVDTESCWPQCCRVMLAMVLCRYQVMLMTVLPSHASNGVV
jgi:hypothetical protein